MLWLISVLGALDVLSWWIWTRWNSRWWITSKTFRLTLEQACYLSGWDEGEMLKTIQVGGVDLSVSGLIETESLREWQEACAEIDHWSDD